MATLKISSDLQNAIKKVVLDTYFPIGKLYLSVGNEDPNKTIGGTWTKISGYYLYADTSINNTSYTGKHTQSHTLTESQIPKHRHVLQPDDFISNGRYFNAGYANKGGAWIGDSQFALAVARNMDTANWDRIVDNNNLMATPYTTFIGGNQGHSHNIATKGIYVWQRTA